MDKKEPRVDYDKVDKLGRVLLADVLAIADPVERAAALTAAAQPTVVAMEEFVVERRAEAIREAINNKVSQVEIARRIGKARSRVDAMLKAGDRAREKRLAALGRPAGGSGS